MNRRPLIILSLSLMGFGISLYLLLVHWGWWEAVCLGLGECELVNQSRYAQLLGVPVALLGAGAYCAFGVMSAMLWRGTSPAVMRRGLFFLAMLGVAFSAYLTYVELFILQAICLWCVLSAILIVLIAGICIRELTDTTP